MSVLALRIISQFFSGHSAIFVSKITLTARIHQLFVANVPILDIVSNPFGMPGQEFSKDDVLVICIELAKQANVFIKAPSSRNNSIDIHGGSSADLCHSSGAQKKGKFYIRKAFSGKKNSHPKRKIPDSTKGEDKKQESVPGLNERDIVAIAILVDEKGTPKKTYTEVQSIPEDEIENSSNVFLSRVPVASKEMEEPASSSNNCIPVSSALNHIDNAKKDRLFKKMSKHLYKLHTGDRNTALSFLKTAMYENIITEIKVELIYFLEKDFKWKVLSFST